LLQQLLHDTAVSQLLRGRTAGACGSRQQRECAHAVCGAAALAKLLLQCCACCRSSAQQLAEHGRGGCRCSHDACLCRSCHAGDLILQGLDKQRQELLLITSTRACCCCCCCCCWHRQHRQQQPPQLLAPEAPQPVVRAGQRCLCVLACSGQQCRACQHRGASHACMHVSV
jgi:hypothetical protein